MSPNTRDDRIFPITRIVLAAVDLVLVTAFVILYFFPQTTRTSFAWEIKPQIMAVFMGAGYLSGAYMFLFAIFGRLWHRVQISLLPVTAFAASMLLVTLLHYDRFIHSNFAFMAWLVIYIITPFLVPWLWYHNRVTDPGTLEANDREVPQIGQADCRAGRHPHTAVLAGQFHQPALVDCHLAVEADPSHRPDNLRLGCAHCS